MDDNNRNFYLALVLSVLVFLVWHFVFVVPKQEEARLRQQQQQELQKKKEAGGPTPPQVGKTAAQPDLGPGVIVAPGAIKDRQAVLDESKRVQIETPSLRGSLSLKGARFDDILLIKQRQKLEKDSPPVELLSPIGAKHPFLADLGWAKAGDVKVNLPTRDTEWKLIKGDVLTPTSPITLQYDAGNGVVFQREIAVDDKFLFTITQKVINNGAQPLDLAPYGFIWRRNKPYSGDLFISHEGAVGMFDGILEAVTYGDVESDPYHFSAKKGWLGITDKYWASALIPDKNLAFKATYKSDKGAKGLSYTTSFLSTTQRIEPGATLEVTNQLFAGAKQGRVLKSYEAAYNIDRFEDLIDWGWFNFITKPLFYVLVYFNDIVHNFGVSILIVTVLIKLLLFPLANKSYKSMAQMKKMQPEMEKIRKRYESDKMKQQQALMDLYKKEKINPLSGCWPVLVQIPIFFALYKVLYVTIEMRHAPFFGWIQDLSAPDPTSIFNLFGLIPIDLPTFLMLGIWPIIMGITMWIQMKLNPEPTDPIQAKIFSYMPIVFTFVLAGFSAGLVIYWAWNNFLSIIQQYVIMKRQGVNVPLLENIGFKKKETSKN